MPKLIIEVIEKQIPMPGEPDRPLTGFETNTRIELCDGEDGEMTTMLPHVLPIVRLAIATAMNAAFGPHGFSGYGTLEDSKEQAISLFSQARREDPECEWELPVVSVD
jgi:hypothetical protein